ncbi:MAG TPA: PLDc N-terminal domain-containing protein [Gaiellaceae bacterium]|nr:PLDc N-terminal domain-containing protein [Gaiellaceae bacterium]
MLVAYSFGQGLAAATLAAFLFVWALVAVRIVRRPDLSVLGKVLWIVAILVPIAGLLVYFIWDAARPRTT